MSLLVLGINHETAPVEVRERLAVRPEHQGVKLAAVRSLPGVCEAVVLSTCNRVEYYAEVDDPGRAEWALLGHVVNGHGLDAGVGGQFYAHHGADAVRHLCRVVSGLDSMVLGETEIFGQVKAAYATAHAAGSTGRALNRVFQRSFAVGKRVRRHTAIQRGATSVGSVAVDLAARIFGELADCHVMVLGAGEMSRTTARSLLSRGARSIIVSNRSYDRACELAEEMEGEALHFHDWPRRVADVDIVVASTAAPHFVITAEHVAEARRRRRGRPLFLIDIAVPRNIDPEVNEMDDVYLYDIDALQALADEARRAREEQIEVCLSIVEEEVARITGYRTGRPDRSWSGLSASQPATDA